MRLQTDRARCSTGGTCSPAATELASPAVGAKTAKSSGKFPLLRAQRVDRDVQDEEAARLAEESGR